MQASFTVPPNKISSLRMIDIPTNVINRGLLSDHSEAFRCFMYQDFSQKLQVYLVNYVYNVNSQHSLSG